MATVDREGSRAAREYAVRASRGDDRRRFAVARRVPIAADRRVAGARGERAEARAEDEAAACFQQAAARPDQNFALTSRPIVRGWLIASRGRPGVSAAIDRLSPRFAMSFVRFFPTSAYSMIPCWIASRRSTSR